jgi:TatD DNase family protein
LHPHEARHWNTATAERLAGLLVEAEVVAVGETGLDYHYDHSPRDRQRAALEAQLDLARRLGKPVVIHAREADDDLAAILRHHPGVTAVLHSFSSGDTLLDAALDLGHYVGLSGMLTFRSWQRDDAVRRVPLNRLLVETDAPYLAPVPNRGKRNEPAWVVHTVARLAQVLGVEVERVRDLTTENARRLFGPRVAPTAS